MKFGFRVPSLKRRIAARTSWKRIVRHRMGLKMPSGMGIITDPKKAIYNKIYRKTTFGLPDLGSDSQGTAVDKTKKVTENGLDEHFKISEEIVSCYRQRDKIPGMLEKAIEACRKQIDLSLRAAQLFKDEYPNQPLPCHVGYDQLVIIYSKQSKYKEAIDLCKQAKEQGWCGDWDKRIKRYEAVSTY